MLRCTVSLAILASTASASVIGGDARIIVPPPAIGNNNFQINEFFAFDELQQQVLAVDLETDQGVIPAGTAVSSHYIAYDPPGNMRLQATVEFDAEVLGVISTREPLIASDFLGSPMTQYQSPSLRGLESDDSYTIDGRTVSMDFRASSPGDYVRIVTRARCGLADVALPSGVLDIDDVLTFLDAFSSNMPLADVAPPFFRLDIDDVLTFLNSFAAGCPD